MPNVVFVVKLQINAFLIPLSRLCGRYLQPKIVPKKKNENETVLTVHKVAASKKKMPAAIHVPKHNTPNRKDSQGIFSLCNNWIKSPQNQFEVNIKCCYYLHNGVKCHMQNSVGQKESKQKRSEISDVIGVDVHPHSQNTKIGHISQNN